MPHPLKLINVRIKLGSGAGGLVVFVFSYLEKKLSSTNYFSLSVNKNYSRAYRGDRERERRGLLLQVKKVETRK